MTPPQTPSSQVVSLNKRWTQGARQATTLPLSDQSLQEGAQPTYSTYN